MAVRLLKSRLTSAALGLFFFAFVLYYALTNIDTFLNYRWRIDYLQLGLSVIALMLAFFGQALVWRGILAKIGHPISGLAAWRIFILAGFGAYVPGRVWQAVGVMKLGLEEKVPVTGVVVSMGLSATLTLGSGVLLAMMVNFGGGDPLSFNQYGWFFLAFVLSLVFSHPRVLQSTLNAALTRLGRASLSITIGWVDLLAILFGYVVTWIVYGGAFFLFVLAMAAVPLSSFFPIVAANAVAYVLGYMAFIAPAGIGVRELTLWAFLQSYVGPEQASALSVLSRLWLLSGHVLSAVMVLALARRTVGGHKRERGYQHEYSRLRPTVLDHEGRVQRAGIIISVMKHFSRQQLHGRRCLDIGCSGGTISAILSDHFSSVVGCDIDLTAVIKAKERYGGPMFVVSDAMRLPFVPNSFDAVCCNQVYEHVPNAKILMAEIHRVLKPGGFCYFAATNRFAPIEGHYHLPALSWFPKPLTNLYLRLARRGDDYYEEPLSYLGLRRLVQGFDVVDYTIKVIKEPARFSAGYRVSETAIVTKMPTVLLRIVSLFFPMYIWILSKRAA